MRKILYGLVLLALFLLPASPAYAQSGPHDGRVIIGQDFTLKSGEKVNGDLVVIGGQVTVEKTAIVQGDIVVIGGSLKLEGEASGNTVVIGGMVVMGAQSSIAGDVVTVGGSLQRANGAKVGGNIVSNLPPPTLNLPVTPQAQIPPIPPTPGFNLDFGYAGRLAGVIVQAIMLAALAMLLSLFLHPQLDRVAQALTQQPLMSGSIGLLTLLVTPIALVILVITLILAPVAAAGVILIVLAWLFGVVALGMEVGDRFTKAIHRTWEPVLSTGAGTFLLAFGLGIVSLVPCVGWLAPLIVGLLGLGAAVMTRFGTQAVNRPGTPALVETGKPESTLPPAS